MSPEAKRVGQETWLPIHIRETEANAAHWTESAAWWREQAAFDLAMAEKCAGLPAEAEGWRAQAEKDAARAVECDGWAAADTARAAGFRAQLKVLTAKGAA